MRADSLIRLDGMRALSERLGLVEAERFITLVIREQFDIQSGNKVCLTICRLTN